MRARLWCLTALALHVALTPVSAQPLPGDVPAADGTAPPPITIRYVDGRVELARPDGVVAAEAPDLLEEDDRLVTGEGRAELLLDDGAVVHVDRDTDLRVDRGVRLRLIRGRIAVHTAAEVEPTIVATPAGLARLAPRGRYDLRADDLGGDTILSVVDGAAALGEGDREVRVEAGDAMSVDPRDPRPSRAHTAGRDAFLDWSERRVGTPSTTSGLPAPLQPWAPELSQNGQWATMAPYGTIWFPNGGPAWRPYQFGSWRFTRYGWTWIDRDPWAWPLHHYGRWGHHDTRGWYWIPQRTWGPAWVGWAVAAQHVAWAPLGWNRRPLVDFTAGVRAGPVGLFASSWSILPRHAFGRRGPVHRDLEDPRRLPGPVLGGFVSQMIGPRGPDDRRDRYLVGGRRPPYNPPPSSRGRAGLPPTAYQRDAAPAERGERGTGGAPRRRPMDAPPVDPAPTQSATPRQRPGAPPAAGAYGGGRMRRPGDIDAPRRVAPAPRTESGPATASPPASTAAPPAGPRERSRAPGWAAPSSRPGTSGGAASGGGESRGRTGGERRAPSGVSRGGAGGRGAGSGGGQARPRG